MNLVEARALGLRAIAAGLEAKTRGVITVGGWQCCVDMYGGLCWLPPSGDKWPAERWAAEGDITLCAADKRGDLMPDFRDAATKGVLLELVRERLHIDDLYPRRTQRSETMRNAPRGTALLGNPPDTEYGWGFFCRCVRERYLLGKIFENSEAEALVAALESAP